MIFHSDKKKVFYPKLFINNSKIERVDSCNFLTATIKVQFKLDQTRKYH